MDGSGEAPAPVRGCAGANGLGELVIARARTGAAARPGQGCLAWGIGVALLGAVVAVAGNVVLSRERVLDVLLFVLAAPAFLWVAAYRAGVTGRRRAGATLPKGLWWSIAAYIALLVLAVPALSDRATTYAGVFAPLASVLVLALPGVFIVGFGRSFETRPSMYVFERGLVAVVPGDEAKGEPDGEPMVFRWADARAYEDPAQPPDKRYELLGAAGSRVVLDGLDQQITPHVLQAIRDAQGPEGVRRRGVPGR
jgi:hypothetical protein